MNRPLNETDIAVFVKCDDHAKAAMVVRGISYSGRVPLEMFPPDFWPEHPVHMLDTPHLWRATRQVVVSEVLRLGIPVDYWLKLHQKTAPRRDPSHGLAAPITQDGIGPGTQPVIEFGPAPMAIEDDWYREYQDEIVTG